MLQKIIVLNLLLILTSPSLAQQFEQKPLTDSVEQADSAKGATTPLPLEQIKNFADIFTRIKSAYIEEVSDEELLD